MFAFLLFNDNGYIEGDVFLMINFFACWIFRGENSGGSNGHVPMFGLIQFSEANAFAYLVDCVSDEVLEFHDR
ncbi:MAG: hypothetical protein EGQ21_07610 [Akkermansia sp.]|nr:hypothetical protein [Akkermansia sp.]